MGIIIIKHGTQISKEEGRTLRRVHGDHHHQTWDANQQRRREDSPTSRWRRSVRPSVFSTVTHPAPLTCVSSRPPCAPLASRSRTRSCSSCSTTTTPTRSPSATSPAWQRSSERTLMTRSQDMINQADRDGDGEINLDEFYRIMKKKGNFLEDLSSDDDF